MLNKNMPEELRPFEDLIKNITDDLNNKIGNNFHYEKTSINPDKSYPEKHPGYAIYVQNKKDEFKTPLFEIKDGFAGANPDQKIINCFYDKSYFFEEESKNNLIEEDLIYNKSMQEGSIKSIVLNNLSDFTEKNKVTKVQSYEFPKTYKLVGLLKSYVNRFTHSFNLRKT